MTRQGYLIEEQGITYLAETDSDLVLAPLQSAACTCRIALGPRAGQNVLTLKTVPTRAVQFTTELCASEHGFSLHADVRCAAHQRNQLERLCRYITRPAIAYNRLEYNRVGDVVLQLKSPYQDGTAPISCCHSSTKSLGAILNNRRLARRVEGRMPGVIPATIGRFSSPPKTQPNPH